MAPKKWYVYTVSRMSPDMLRYNVAYMITEPTVDEKETEFCGWTKYTQESEPTTVISEYEPSRRWLSFGIRYDEIGRIDRPKGQRVWGVRHGPMRELEFYSEVL